LYYFKTNCIPSLKFLLKIINKISIDYGGKILVIFINHEDININTKISIGGKTRKNEKIQDLIGGRQINLENFTIEANGVVAILLEKGV
jgi:hypothetical protein